MPKKEIRANIFFHSEFDLLSLLSLAKRIRGKPCFCDQSQHPKSGSLNWAISIYFEDSIEWIFRSPRKDYFVLREESISTVLASEAATLNCLRDKSGLPVPEVFSFSPTHQNDIGVPYILMSKAHGKPLAYFGWDSNGDALDKVSNSSLTLHQKEKVMRQLGKIHGSLSNLRFDRIGSLLRVEDDYTLERCLSPALIWHGRDEFDESDIPLGPFEDAASFYRAQTLALLAHVRELHLEHHVFHALVPIRQEYNTFSEYRPATDRWNDYVTVGSKIESATNRLEHTSAGLAILYFVPLLAERENQIISPGFPLFHPDLSTNNLFVDDDLNISCIIDWACTSSVPKSMLLVCPGLPHSRNPPSLDCIASFKEGFLEGKGFDGQPALPFENSNDLWQFAHLVNLDSIQDYDHFSKLFQSLAPGQELYTKLHDLKKRDEFVNSLKVVSQYTATSEEIRNEKQYFECNGSERLAPARHMTTMANLNPRFVADQRLWKWVSIYLKERDTYMFPTVEREVN